MKKIKLLNIFKAFTESPHHLAAISTLESEMPEHLLDRNAEWVICFEAESESNPQIAKYNI